MELLGLILTRSPCAGAGDELAHFRELQIRTHKDFR
jgi:hypothetical protein